MQYLSFALAALSYAAAMGGTYAANVAMDRYAVIAPAHQAPATESEVEPSEERED